MHRVIKVVLFSFIGSPCVAGEKREWYLSGTPGAALVPTTGPAPGFSGCSEKEGEDLFHFCPGRQVQLEGNTHLG